MITFVSVPRPRRNAGLSRVQLLSSAKTAPSQLKSQFHTISCSPGTSGTTGGGGCCLRSPLRSCWCYLCCALGQRPALWTVPRQRTTKCWWMKWRNRYHSPFRPLFLGAGQFSFHRSWSLTVLSRQVDFAALSRGSVDVSLSDAPSGSQDSGQIPLAPLDKSTSVLSQADAVLHQQESEQHLTVTSAARIARLAEKQRMF